MGHHQNSLSVSLLPYNSTTIQRTYDKDTRLYLRITARIFFILTFPNNRIENFKYMSVIISNTYLKEELRNSTVINLDSHFHLSQLGLTT